ncbi:GntR family transcriptional regulator [Rhodococcus artemisiae]|uniref:GntR family transcriptional regulator n=1 Tax=Rhodococcus artemisiae TaxID=714159 RepID=A0ABU7L9U8_9NOCA|nr:GntR family transcriptional regulator [Rhodococcus artemisiae]MEE2058072.1 GntR family transcriptional regulator [Rhodococcus artemisiae]
MTRENVVRSVAPRAASAVDLVLHEIRRSILDGSLAPGEPLVVQSLTEQLGVSHVPVREALRQLQAQGMIRLSRSRSAVVAPIDLDDLRSIYRLRLCMEPELAVQSAMKRSDDELDGLDELVTALCDHDDTESRWDLHREFHAQLISPAAGEWGMRFLNQLWDASERYTRLTFDPIDAASEDRVNRERSHRALVDAARSRLPEKINEEVRNHLLVNEATAVARLAKAVTRG